MKKLFTLITLGSFTLLSADQPYGSYGYDNNSNSYPANNNRNSTYQGQANNSGYYQPNQSSTQQPFNQNSQGNYNSNNSNYGSQNNADQKPVSDQEMIKNIHDALGAGWFSKGYQNVSFNVNNGNVTLRGYVESLDSKNKVLNEVKKINGVRQVNDQIMIAAANTSTYSDTQLQDSEKKFPEDRAITSQDRQLNARIRDKLNGGWFSSGYKSLVIKSNNGDVTINGTVAKVDDIQKINNQLQAIEGVKSINNQVTVRNP